MWYTTLNKQVALEGGYIGETLGIPKLLAVQIRIILGRRPPRPFIFYYFGKPNTALKERFNHKEK